MQIEKKEDHYLLSNEHGEYHFSIEDYESLGIDAAKEKASSEIKKKSKAQYFNKTINFDQARDLGFCEYGIKDFCKKLELDIDKDHSIKDVSSVLTLEVLKEYSSECLKLFGKGIIEKFGGVEGILKDCEDSSTLYFIVDSFIEDDILHKFSVKAAYYSLKNFEDIYPNDNRPRLAIEAKEKFIKGEISEEELLAARSAAWSAAWSAARSAESAVEAAAYSAWSSARSARSAAESAVESAASAVESAASAVESAAESAARSAAAYSVAESAAESAARSAASAVESAASAVESAAAYSVAYKYFSEELLKLLKENN
jgi:hypothetical protein